MADRSGVPAGTARLLVYGGTFDPPHRGHLELADVARLAIGADWLLFVPTVGSPHRDGGPTVSLEDRARMLETSLPARASVSRIEEGLAGSDGRVRSLTMLCALREALGSDVQFRLLIGADQAVAFHRWHEPRRVIEIAEPAVLLRAPWETRDRLIAAMRDHWARGALEDWRRWVVDAPLMEVSATGMREALAAGRTELLPEGVRDFIRARGLYGVSSA